MGKTIKPLLPKQKQNIATIGPWLSAVESDACNDAQLDTQVCIETLKCALVASSTCHLLENGFSTHMTLVSAFAAISLLGLLSLALTLRPTFGGQIEHWRQRSPLNTSSVTEGGLQFRKSCRAPQEARDHLTHAARHHGEIVRPHEDGQDERAAHTPHEETGNK